MASLIPPGFTPDLAGLDLSNHNSAVGTIIRVNAAFAAIIAVVIAVRLYVRWRIVRRVGSDDILMLVAGFFTISLSAVCIVGTRFGLGRHEWDLNLSTVLNSTIKIIKTLFVCQVLYVTAVTFTKASIMASYLRILPVPFFRRLMYVTAAIVVALWICSVCVTIFQCDPIEGAWDFELQRRKCLPIEKFFYFQSALNIMTDLILCTSPLPLFWSLNIALNERIMLCTLFGFGLFATVASVIRLSQLHNLNSVDFSHACVSSLNWSVVEVGTGIVCASVPALKPLIVHFFPGRFFSMARDSRRQATRTDPSFMSVPEPDGYALEMSSHPQRNTTFLEARFDRDNKL